MEALIQEQKKKLRSEFLKKRKSLSDLEYKKLNKILKITAAHFLSSFRFSKIFIFHPILNEPDLRLLISVEAFGEITLGFLYCSQKKR